MKIAYFAVQDLNIESGVLKKIVNQITAWNKLGATAKLFAISSSTSRQLSDCLNSIQIEALHVSHRRYGLLVYRQLFARIMEWAPDVIYLRFDFYFPFLANLMKRVPTFVEVTSNDLTEYRVQLSKVAFLYHSATRDLVLRNARGFLFLTPETANNYRQYERPYQVIGDGIDFKQYARTVPPSSPSPRLVFIGNGIYPWFGIDKMMLLANTISDWQFDLIGVAPGDIKEPVPSNVIAHGYLMRDRYETIMQSADVALGSLALHRINMNETTSLKVREYLAYGLPTILGYRDPDLDDARFILSLPNVEGNVQEHISDIKAFVGAWKGKRVPMEDITHLSLEAKERLRVDFMESNC